MLTDEARKMEARADAEDITLGDWHWQVGTSGFNGGDPTLATAVDPTLQALVAPVGGTRFLGRVLSSGAGATITHTTGFEGIVQVNGLSAMPSNAAHRWLRLSGSGNPAVNGTWLISKWLSATSVLICAPLVVVNDAGPLNWEFREACIFRPNPRARSFHGRLLDTGDAADGLRLGEVGIFCRVIRSSFDPGLLGNSLLYSVAHVPARTKVPEGRLSFHCVTQS